MLDVGEAEAAEDIQRIGGIQRHGFAQSLTEPNVWFNDRPVTWAELVRKLKDAGFTELRAGKGSHRQFWNPETKKVVTVAVHTKKEVGTGLLNRIIKDAGLTNPKERKS